MAAKDQDVTQNRRNHPDHNGWRNTRPIPETPAHLPGTPIPTPHQPFQYYEPRHAGTTSLDAPQNGTQPTQNDPTLEADSWDARTGTFRSNSGEFGLEAPAIIAEQEFAQQRDSNHIDSRMNDPDQQALILESLNDNDPDWGELAFGGRDAAGNWVDGREDPNEFAEISDEVREQIRENDELERG